MLIAARHVIDRMRGPRARADEARALRERLAAAPGAEEAGEERARLARDVVRLKRAVSGRLTGLASCAGCSRGHPMPHGRWDGGHCCGGRTEELFSDDEVRALRLGGTTPARLSPPSSDHAGCAFRGPRGCSLDVADRPALCVRYLCRELEEELRRRGDLALLKSLTAELEATFARLRRSSQTSPPTPR